ncbi:MAG TPA: type I pullulanase [Bacteroidales bacterium]|nr:type I pullulanase [Bacteroidales bacterium]
MIRNVIAYRFWERRLVFRKFLQRLIIKSELKNTIFASLTLAENEPKLYPIITFAQMLANSRAISDQEESFPFYSGDNLGVSWTPERTMFRIWSPNAKAVVIKIYEKGYDGIPLGTYDMNKSRQGTWTLSLEGNLINFYYTFQALIGNEWKHEVPDTYVKAVGVNGNRGMIIDFAETNPEGWEHDMRPHFENFNDIVLWEVHVRDFSIHPSSGSKYPGKYLAFTERGTKSPEGFATGIGHLLELGVTHVHLLPVFDFFTVDESRPDFHQYNWGYDPKNLNVPDGWYATDPFDGRVRIREFKQMVQALHKAGLGVIMDVVYNHMYDASVSPFEQLVPGYFFRKLPDGSLANGSGCGNEIASEKPMVQKFIVDSVKFWATEYHIDGFRFDLMGLLDSETMNQVRLELDRINPKILIYGEGWVAGDTPLEPHRRATKNNLRKLDGIAVFSDEIRDGIRGNAFQNGNPGFMTGNKNLKESVKFGVVAATKHPQVYYQQVNYSKSPYSDSPLKTISYVTCHDNPVLWDIINSTCKNCNESEKLDIQKLANGIVLTSQGIPFLHAGEEIVRTKSGEHNSYNLPDAINQIDWSNKAKYYEVFRFYSELINLRKNHPAFRMTSVALIQKHLSFLDIDNPLVVGFLLANNANGDKWKKIMVFYNAACTEVEVELPEDTWRIVATKFQINENGVSSQGYDKPVFEKTLVPSRSIMILVDNDSI